MPELGEGVDDRERPARAQGVEQERRVGPGVAGPRVRQLDPHAERAEQGLVAREAEGGAPAPVAAPGGERDAGVGVDAGQAHDPPSGALRVPARQRRHGAIEDGRQTLRSPEAVAQGGRGEVEDTLVAPLAVGVQPFDAVDRQGPVPPGELRLGRSRVGDDAEPAQARDVLDHARRLSAEGVGRAPEAQGQVVAPVRADLDRVQAEHAGAVRRGVRRPGTVPVVGEHDEVESGAAGRGGDLGRRTAAVRAACCGCGRRPARPRRPPGTTAPGTSPDAGCAAGGTASHRPPARSDPPASATACARRSGRGSKRANAFRVRRRSGDRRPCRSVPT